VHVAGGIYAGVLRSVRRRDGGEAELYLAAAFVAQAFFTVCTEMHENHGMAVVPLLALASPARPRVIGPLLALASLAFFANLILFDPAAAPPGLRPTIGTAAPALAVGVSALNVGLLGALAVCFGLPPTPTRAHSRFSTEARSGARPS